MSLTPQPCACGCGELAAVDERRNRVSKYRSGHNGRVSHGMKGRPVSAETRAKLASYTGDKAASYKHGWSGTPTYKVWSSMLGRCYDPRNASYPSYGGRGVTVCQRWRDDFLDFLADMGARPSLDYQIDRIDTTGDYEPGNCRWLTRAENNARPKRPRQK